MDGTEREREKQEKAGGGWIGYFVCLFDLILICPLNNLSVMRDGSSWVEPVLS